LKIGIPIQKLILKKIKLLSLMGLIKLGTNKAEDVSKVSQILFDARDGKEVFTFF